MAGDMVMGSGRREDGGCGTGIAAVASIYTAPAALAWSVMLVGQAQPVPAALVATGPVLRVTSRVWLVHRNRVGEAWDAWGNPAAPERATGGAHRILLAAALPLEVGAAAIALLAGLPLLFGSLLICLAVPAAASLILAAWRAEPDLGAIPVRYSPVGRSRWRRSWLAGQIPWLVGLAVGLDLVRAQMALVAAFAVLLPLAVLLWPFRPPAPGEPDGTMGRPPPAQFDFVGPIDPEAADALGRQAASHLRHAVPTFEDALGFAPSRTNQEVRSPIGARYTIRTLRHGTTTGPLTFTCIVNAPDRFLGSRPWQVRYEPGRQPVLLAPEGHVTPWPDDLVASDPLTSADLSSDVWTPDAMTDPTARAEDPHDPATGALVEQAWTVAQQRPWSQRPTTSDLRDVLVDHPDRRQEHLVVETVDIPRSDSAILVISDTHLVLGTSLHGRGLRRALPDLPVPVRSDAGRLWVLTLPLEQIAHVAPVLTAGVRLRLLDGRELALDLPALATSPGIAELAARIGE